MPELICFLFEVASAYAPDDAGDLQGSIDARTTFLDGIIRPIYDVVFAELFLRTSKGRPVPKPASETPKSPMNYDDWNEAFWSRSSLGKLRTGSSEGVAVLEAPPYTRWWLLLEADWKSFFESLRKTHTERRWWSGLLMANRRIFFVHLFLFTSCVYVRFIGVSTENGFAVYDKVVFSQSCHWQESLNTYWLAAPEEFNNTIDIFAACFPLILLVPALLNGLGRLYEHCTGVAWTPCVKQRWLLFQALLMLALQLALVIARFIIVWDPSVYTLGHARVADDSTDGFRKVGWVYTLYVALIILCAFSTVNLFNSESQVQIDNNLFFERHTAWGGWASTKQAMEDSFCLFAFWAIVWACKLSFFCIGILPTVFDVTVGSIPKLQSNCSDQCVKSVNQADQILKEIIDGQEALSIHMSAAHSCPSGIQLNICTYSVEDSKSIADSLRYALPTSATAKSPGNPVVGYAPTSVASIGWFLAWWLIALTWIVCFAAFIADTLYWYQLVVGVWGGVLGIFRRGIMLPGWSYRKVADMMITSQKKLLAKAEQPNIAWIKLWSALVTELYDEFIISTEERKVLIDSPFKVSSTVPCSKEARRRLEFFVYSIEDPALQSSKGVLATPCLSVLTPQYGEPILMPTSQLKPPEDPEFLKPLLRKNDFSEWAMGYLVNFFDAEWSNLKEHYVSSTPISDNPAADVESFAQFEPVSLRQLSRHRSDAELSLPPAGQTSASASASILKEDVEIMLRKWASCRMQTYYRTIKGMMKARKAYSTLLSLEAPGLNEAEHTQILYTKFQCLCAMQRYSLFTAEERADVEILLDEFPLGLSIGYFEEEKINGTSRFYACLVDGGCRLDPASKRRKPKYRIELPGHPILSGKSDNQNCSIIFARGYIIQAIDVNQEGYLEECIKLPSTLREFEGGMGSSPPTIVGFREHIFSSLGLMGDFGASSELVFGTLTQRTMSYPLQSRLHYGHPDMMDKLAMMAQGGISKGTKSLNLSEDIFAGMDAMLRGQRIVYREYFQVGKVSAMHLNTSHTPFCAS